MPGRSYEFHGTGRGVMARRSATESAGKDELYPPSVKGPQGFPLNFPTWSLGPIGSVGSKIPVKQFLPKPRVDIFFYGPHCDLTGIKLNKGNHPEMRYSNDLLASYFHTPLFSIGSIDHKTRGMPDRSIHLRL